MEEKKYAEYMNTCVKCKRIYHGPRRSALCYMCLIESHNELVDVLDKINNYMFIRGHSDAEAMWRIANKALKGK